ncbi:ROK family protein [Lysinibacillus halotolerans]|uniref:ROK family protein n=1 Tax=Lysinibacillus halotolerans TaxID=1368476 RepID=A0A3M8H4L3_9BACI|nr:ROK family protein [Lysinibacillus halotolerans]RNC97249.1 ROK family protein [Lysinibacillus halotolerans]
MKILVFDIGGTSFRRAIYENGTISGYKKTDSPNFLKFPDKTIDKLQEELVTAIFKEYFNISKETNIDGVAISFPGIVYNNEFINEAATLWGRYKKTLNLKKILNDRISLPIYILNDVTAAGYKISKNYKRFCVITISSGIGNKVFWDGYPLLNNGLGGEIGHINVGHSIMCNCGNIGHLGAVSSGRGVIQLANLLKNELSNYKDSSLFNQDINTFNLVNAFKEGDLFAEEVIRKSLKYLANIINVHINSLGITKYVLIGGFALALGKKYRDFLTNEILKLNPFIINNPEMFEELIILEENTDTHCLEGAGIFAELNRIEVLT